MANQAAKRGPGRPRKAYRKTSVSVSPVGDAVWEVAAERLGLQKSPALEVILRDYASRHDIPLEEPSEEGTPQEAEEVDA